MLRVVLSNYSHLLIDGCYFGSKLASSKLTSKSVEAIMIVKMMNIICITLNPKLVFIVFLLFG